MSDTWDWADEIAENLVSNYDTAKALRKAKADGAKEAHRHMQGLEGLVRLRLDEVLMAAARIEKGE